jgi:hypothetical protein
MSLAHNSTVHAATVDHLITLGTRSADDVIAILEPLLKTSVLTAKQRRRVIESDVLRATPEVLGELLGYQHLSPGDITSLIAVPEVAADVATYVLQRPTRYRVAKRRDLETLLDLCTDPTTRLAWLARLPDRFSDRVTERLADSAKIDSLGLDAVSSLLEVRPELMDTLIASELPIGSTLAESRHLCRLDQQLRVVGLDQLSVRRIDVAPWLSTYYFVAQSLVNNPRCHREVLETMLAALYEDPQPERDDFQRLSVSIQDRLSSLERRPTVVGAYEEISDYATLLRLTERSETWERSRRTSFVRQLDASALLENPNLPSWRKPGLRRNASRPKYVTLRSGSNQYLRATPASGRRAMKSMCCGRCRPDPDDASGTLQVGPTEPYVLHRYSCTMSAWGKEDSVSYERASIIEQFVHQTLPTTNGPWWHQSGASLRAGASQLTERLGNSPRTLETFLGLKEGWRLGVDELIETSVLLAAN